MNSLSQSAFKNHLGSMLRIDRGFREEFTDLILQYHIGDITKLSKCVVDRFVHSTGISNRMDIERGLINLLNDQKIVIFIRVMQMTKNRIPWTRRLRNIVFSDDTGVDLFRISNATLKILQFQAFDNLDEEERFVLEQLSLTDIDLISDLTELGFIVFSTISRLSKKEISFLLSLTREQLDLLMKFGFESARLLSSLDKRTRNKFLGSETDVKMDKRLVDKMPELNEEELARLGFLIHDRGAIMKDFGIKENMDEVLKRISQCSEKDVITLSSLSDLSFSEMETEILKRIPFHVFEIAAALTRTELDEILLLPKGMFETISSEKFRIKLEDLARDIPEGYPLIPIIDRSEKDKDHKLGLLNQDQRTVLARLYNLPSRAVGTLLDLDLDRIRRVMTSEVGLNRKEAYLKRQLNNLSPQNRHDIVWMTDAEWNSFHSIRSLEESPRNALMNMYGPEIEILRAMNLLNEKQLEFVAKTSRTGLGILATNSRLGPRTIHSIMRLENEEEKEFLLNLDLKTRFLIGNGTRNHAMSLDGERLLKEMSELNAKEKWWIGQTRFTELLSYLNRHKAKVFGDLFEKIESDKHPVFDVWNGEELSEMDTKLLANVIIAQRPKSIEFLPVSDFLDSIFFMELLQLSVEASCDQALRLNIIQEIRRRDFKVRALVNVYDYSKRQHVQSLRWILMNSLEPGNEILFDFARMTLFDNLYKRNNLTFKQIFLPTSEEVVPALHKQFAVEEYHLAKALFFHLSDSTRLFEILNPVDCSILLESDITKDTHTIPYVDELTRNGHDLFPIFPTNTIKLLRVSNYLNRGDVVPLLKKLAKERLVEFFHTDLGNEFLHSSLSNGRVNLLRYLRQRFTEEELKSIIRKKDYSLSSVRSGKHGQHLATILHMLREIDPEISNDIYIQHSTELIKDVQVIAPPATTISILRSLPIDSIKLQDLIGSMWDALNPEVRSILSNQVSNGCNDSSIPCIDSRDQREIPSGAKNIFNKVANTNSEFMQSFKEKLWNAEYDLSNPIILSIVEILWPDSGGLELIRKIRTSAILSLIAGQHDQPPANDSIYEIAEHTASRFPQVPRKSIQRFLAMMGPGDLDSVDIAEDHSATTMVVDYLREHISRLEKEDHFVYWSMFWNNETTKAVEIDNDSETRLVMERYARRVLDRFKADYDSIGISLPWWMVWKRESYVRTLPWELIGEHGRSSLLNNVPCFFVPTLFQTRLVFNRRAVVREPYNRNQTLGDSSFLPKRFGDYNFVCGPSSRALNIDTLFEDKSDNFNEFCNAFPGDSQWKTSMRQFELPGTVEDRCQNMILYEKKGPSGSNSMLYVAQDHFEWESSQSRSIDLIFLGKKINFVDSGNGETTNRFMLKGDLTACKIHKKGLNFFYTDKNEFLCDLDITQDNVAVIHEDFVDSENIRSVIGDARRNKITISHASFVDGGGGGDEIIALHSTIVRAHFGDLIIGSATVVLPGSIDRIHSIAIGPQTYVFWYGYLERIEVDRNCKLMLANGYYVKPFERYRIRGIVLRKVLQVHSEYDEQLTELKNMRNDKFELVKHLSTPTYNFMITGMNHNVFVTDRDDRHYYWEAPPDSRNLYIFTKLNSTATISQANGVLDFTSLDITVGDITLRKTNGGFTMSHGSLHVILLPNYNEVRMTSDGKEYYRLYSDDLERDYCSHPMKMSGRISIDSLDFMYHYNCLDVRSNKVHLVRSDEHLILVSKAGTLYLKNYYLFVHNKMDLSLRLNSYIMEPAEVWRRASNPSSIKYHEVDKQGLEIYHNQPDNEYEIGLVNLGGWPLTKCNMTFSDDDLSISLGKNSSVTVKNWKTQTSSRDIVFHFKDETPLNTGCIISDCYPDDVLHEFEMMKFQRSKRETNNFGLFLSVFQNWLDRKYPLPVQHCDAPEEIFANAHTLTETFENAMNTTAEKFHISLDGFDSFDVYKNVSRLMRAEKYSLILEDFRKTAETFGLDGDILLDRFFENIKESC